MTRSDHIDRIAAQFHQLQLNDAEESVKPILDALRNTLAKVGRAEIWGFGPFQLNYKPLRNGRYPVSGEKVMVPANYVPLFNTGRELRARVDSK